MKNALICENQEKLRDSVIPAEPSPLTDQEYRLIRDLVYDNFGINLGQQKRALIIGRLQKVLRENGFTNFTDYYRYVISEPSGEALTRLIDRISTNHTFFYREKDHFKFYFESVLPQIFTEHKSKSAALRIWCPGCSTGEEPYTLGMLLLEFLTTFQDGGSQTRSRRGLGGSPAPDVGILATDISSRVLKIAQAGVYSAESVRHLPADLVRKYFSPRSDGSMLVHPKLQELVTFRRLNLMRESYPFKGRFHIIFCRNVMIYFDHPTRLALTQRFHRYLEPDGFLFIGHSETLGRSNSHFRYIKPAIYQKVG
jgi:chemotaxis protein methyltransferase CheR